MATKFSPVPKISALPMNPWSRVGGNTNRRATSLVAVLSLSALIAILALYSSTGLFTSSYFQGHVAPKNAQEILAKCWSLKTPPGLSPGFEKREVSDRYEPGTNATWIRNCRILTGEKNGSVIIHGDLFLDKGIVRAIGKVPWHLPDNTPNVSIIDADGAWFTPGLIDLHSHVGVLPSPVMKGTDDYDSQNGPILPWLRTIDGFNTHDDAFQLAIAGGVTTVQVLPGSSNAIGGEAFIVKLRKTSDRSASSMLVEPPSSLKGLPSDDLSPPVRWRYMKQACGENLRRYGNRMDTMWALRSAFNQARLVKQQQDAYCAKAEAGLWGSIEARFPESPDWELLVDVLRGKVKISSHCYEAVDLDAMVRLSNEFEFPITSFHHAAEAYLVPEVLKRTWGGTPAVALFATNHRYKREAFRGSEFAPRILVDQDIPVIMKSDHPVINSRYLMNEAQQAHYYGLPPNRAVASVTSIPATALGLWHRIGTLFEGADADIVMWDSHPLQLGATPKKVWIDGILQIPVPARAGENTNVEVGKGKEGDEWQRVPRVPNWDKESNETIQWEGLPPLHGKKARDVVFKNVARVFRRGMNGTIEEAFSPGVDALGRLALGTVVVENGKLTYIGQKCDNLVRKEVVDIRGGSIFPGMMTYGSPLGLEEIESEPTTGDGEPYDAFRTNIPSILDDVGGVLRAMDALVFGTRNALLAFRSGVTIATSSLIKRTYASGHGSHIISGLSVAFRTGSGHAMERGAIVQDMAALHVVLGRSDPLLKSSAISVSTQLAALRRLLFGWEGTDKETGDWFRKAAEGIVPLVVETHNADIMASLIILKAEVEEKIGSRMRMAFSGATEAHMLARELRDADIGVILHPTRPYPAFWDQRRILPGPPLTNDTALVTLIERGVTVGLGVQDAWDARNTRFNVDWAMLESNGRIHEADAITLVTTNLERLLGIRGIDEDFVVYEGGGMFDQTSKVVGVISQEQMTVHLF
ncbi:carbohydrate esterase family 9 protein [Amanita muscaria]